MTYSIQNFSRIVSSLFKRDTAICHNMDESGDILLSEMSQMSISLWDVREKKTTNQSQGQGEGKMG